MLVCTRIGAITKESVGGASLIPVVLHPRPLVSSHHSVYVIETASTAELQPCKIVHHHGPPLRDSKSNGSKASTRSLLFTQYVCTPDESKSHYVQAQQSEGTRVPPADFLICNADQQISAFLHLSDRLTITPRYSSKRVQHGDLRFRITHGYITVVY